MRVWESLILGMPMMGSTSPLTKSRAVSDHAFFVREQALEAHVIGHVGEGGAGAGHENSCALKSLVPPD